MDQPINTSIVYEEMHIKSAQLSPTYMEVRSGGGDWAFSKCANQAEMMVTVKSTEWLCAPQMY